MIFIKVITLILSILIYTDVALSSQNPYEVLGISNQSTLNEATLAYRRLIRQLHPDVNDSNPQQNERLVEVIKAYDAIKSQLALKESKPTATAAALKRADRIAAQIKDNNFVYNKSEKTLYDKRLGFTLNFNPVFGQFITSDGWILDLSEKTYQNIRLDARWSPELGWHRIINNYMETIAIDPLTGFPHFIRYSEPTTVSQYSSLFDEILNPKSWISNYDLMQDHVSKLLSKFKTNQLANEEIADYKSRLRATINIFLDPRFDTAFGMTLYTRDFLRLLLNPLSLEFPELVVHLISNARDFTEGYQNELLDIFLARKFLTHTNANEWNKAILAHPQLQFDFIYLIISSESIPELSYQKFINFYALILEKGIRPDAIKAILTAVDDNFEEKGFETFFPILEDIISDPQFLEMIATLEPRYTIKIQKFLNWYKTQNSKLVEIFLNTLSMPGANKKDFRKYVDDAWVFDEAEYNKVLKKTRADRLKYLNRYKSLIPQKRLVKSTGQTLLPGGCYSFFLGR